MTGLLAITGMLVVLIEAAAVDLIDSKGGGAVFTGSVIFGIAYPSQLWLFINDLRAAGVAVQWTFGR